MRIGLVLDHFDPRRGGVERWTDQFARQLLRLGHEVHVVATTFSPTPELSRSRTRECSESPKSHDFGYGNLGYGTRPKWIVPHPIPPHGSRLERAQSAEDLLRQLDLDIIHDMGFGWYCDILQPHGGSRTAAEERNLAMSPAWLRPFQRTLAPWLPHARESAALTNLQLRASPGPVVLAVSQMVYRDMQRLHGLPDARLRLIDNGVDVEHFTPQRRDTHRKPTRLRLGVSDNEVLFLIAADTTHFNGLPTLIRALGLLRSEGVAAKVVVVGSSPTRAMRQLAQWHGVASHVIFAGCVDDARDYYAAADVSVQPTFYDPCSFVVLEALACGLPVITTSFQGASELLTIGEQGYVLDNPADASALAELMRQTLNADRRATMSHAARQLALQHTVANNARQIVEVYEELANIRPAAHRRLPFAA